MAAQIGLVDRHGDEVSLTWTDIAIATRAEVGLGGFIRLDVTHLNRKAHRIEFGFRAHVRQPNNAQMTRPTHVASAAATIT